MTYANKTHTCSPSTAETWKLTGSFLNVGTHFRSHSSNSVYAQTTVWSSQCGKWAVYVVCRVYTLEGIQRKKSRRIRGKTESVVWTDREEWMCFWGEWISRDSSMLQWYFSSVSIQFFICLLERTKLSLNLPSVLCILWFFWSVVYFKTNNRLLCSRK